MHKRHANKQTKRNKVFYYDYSKIMKQEKDVKKAKFFLKRKNYIPTHVANSFADKNNFPCFWRLVEIAQNVAHWIEFLG